MLSSIILLLFSQIWTVAAIDFKYDGRDRYSVDAAQLSYRYEKENDLLWFRVSLYGRSNMETAAVKLTGDTGTPVIKRGKEVRIEGDSLIVGVKRLDLTSSMKLSLSVTVGSNESWNDDIPNASSVAIDLGAPRPVRGIREIDLSRNNLRFASDYRTLPDAQPPLITTKGRGRQTFVLIPGVYSGKDVFNGFIARNESKYRFFVLTPPGLNGTAARALPSESVSYGELPWTRQLERDILALLEKEKLTRPILVAHGFPGSLAAHEVARQHPEKIGGIINIASMPAPSFPSTRDPNGGLASRDERMEYVNEGWADKWFKYVTPDTWESNNYPAAMFANDPNRAESVRQEIEAAPLPVKIRYLSEYMASKDTSELAALKVPMLVLAPAFSDEVLANPAYSWFKTSFQDGWNVLSGNANVRLVTIPNARALMFDDQPKLVDEAIAAFISGAVTTRKDQL